MVFALIRIEIEKTKASECKLVDIDTYNRRG